MKRTPDPELTELGWRQAQALAKHLAAVTAYRHPGRQELAAYGMTHLYCSAMLRAMQTAQPIAQALALTPEVWVDIHEQGGLFYGNPRQPESLIGHSGMTRRDMQARFPGYQVPPEVTDAGWWREGCESREAFYARALKVAEYLRQLARRHHDQGRDERIALVIHGDLIDLLLKALLEQLPGDSLRYVHAPTAITRVDFPPSGPIYLHYVNRTEHLTPEIFDHV
ncbi:histidine phosphatase family protein [Candidatus Entotheonella palauensis]|uniref:histidine phosphatase family protein n=1 Tax=Candidatus Entotheonella palauensis TaxID=93172 RepID=UPI0015C4A523|nr:histidine phosphatase family protein [Candidatus Entotheonella palauensis]